MKKQIKALVENIDGKMVAVASDDSVDRQGDSIPQENWDLRNFKKNPVLLLSHQYHLPPIGVARNIKLEGKRLTFEPVFHNITSQAREVGQMFAEGIMRAFSVGFMSREDNKNELLEISAVSVPANANALIMGKGFTDEEKKSVDEWLNEVVSEKSQEKTSSEEVLKTLLANISEINDRLNDIEKGRQADAAKSKNMEIMAKSLESLNRSLGYLNRKIGK